MRITGNTLAQLAANSGRRGGGSLHPSYTNPLFRPQMCRLKYTYPVSLLMPHRGEKKVSGVDEVKVSHEIALNNTNYASGLLVLASL